MINVTIRVTLRNGILEVDESEDVNEISEETTITWRLRRSCPGPGSFNAIDDLKRPGFAWIKPIPPSGVFDHLKPGERGNKITIQDHPGNADSTGEYQYRLCATINGKQYSTDEQHPDDCKRKPRTRMTNPKIKNV